MNKTIEKRIRASKGEIPFDELYVNAKIVNTYTHRIIEHGSVGVVDGVIASVCPSFVPSANKVIDCNDKFLAPSFIDAHMHIESSRLNPMAYAQAAVPHGSGCIMTDPMQLVNATGDDGFFCFLDMLKDVPMRAFIQFPSRVPAAKGLEHSGAEYSPLETIEKLVNSGAISLGEVNSCNLLESDVLEKLVLANEKDLLINGHCPGLSSDDLMAAANAHICDDHESETFEEAINRLNAGISVMVREGTVEPNCREIIRGVIKENLPTDNMMFCTDDKSPEDIVKRGCIDNCIRIAIEEGLNPIDAICMATINPARHFHMEEKMGVIAPGRHADFILFDKLESISVDEVYFAGKLVAKKGKLIGDLDYKDYPKIRNTVKLPRELLVEDLSPEKSDTQILISMIPGSLMTIKEVIESEYDYLNRVEPDTKNDILPIAVIDRYTGVKHIGNALIKGLGIKRGAVASSCAQEGNNVVVSGASYEDMLIAVKEVERLGGGNVVVVDGKVVGKRKLAYGGIMSDEDLEEALKSNYEFSDALKLTGSENSKLITELTVSLCPSIPQIGLTDLGIIEIE